MIPITITYTPYAEGVKIIGVTGRAAEIRIPDHIDGLPVIAIAPMPLRCRRRQRQAKQKCPPSFPLRKVRTCPEKPL